MPVTFWSDDGCWANAAWQILKTSNICGDAAKLPEQAVPSPADHPPIVMLRGISRNLVDPTTLTDLAIVINTSVLRVSFFDAACATISSSQDLALGGVVLPLSSKLQVSEPFDTLLARVDLLPGRGARNLTYARTGLVVCLEFSPAPLHETRHLGFKGPIFGTITNTNECMVQKCRMHRRTSG
jgi:hypothetical protein